MCGQVDRNYSVVVIEEVEADAVFIVGTEIEAHLLFAKITIGETASSLVATTGDNAHCFDFVVQRGEVGRGGIASGDCRRRSRSLNI